MMNTQREAIEIAEALETYMRERLESAMRNCVRSKKMICTTAPNGREIGVKESLGGQEIFVPYISTLHGSQVGDVVWVDYRYNQLSTAVAVMSNRMFGKNN